MIVTKTSSNIKKDNNVVKLCGTIVNLYSAPKAIVITLGITEMTRRGRVSNYPKLYFFKEDNTGIEQFVLHDRIEVTGHIATPIKTRRNGKTYASQAIIGDKAERPSVLYPEFNSNNDDEEVMHKGTENLVFLHGVLTSVKPADKDASYARLIVLAENKGHKNYVILNARGDQYFMYKPGDVVDIYAKVLTNVKEDQNGHKRYFENIRPIRMYKISDASETGDSNGETPTEDPVEAAEYAAEENAE